MLGRGKNEDEKRERQNEIKGEKKEILVQKETGVLEQRRYISWRRRGKKDMKS